MDPRRALAFHEAGHAVAHVLLRRPFASVTVLETETAAGAVDVLDDLRFRSKRPAPHLVSAELTAVLAGAVAEWMAGGREGDPWDLEGTGPDFEHAGTLARWLAPDEDRREAQRIARLHTADAEQLLDRHWRGVEAVAEALLARGTLTARDVARLARRARVTAE